MLLAPFFWAIFIPGLYLMELRFCGLLCGMISRALNLVELLPVMTPINLGLYIGHMRVGIAMPYRLLGVADHDDDGAYQELLKHHPTSPCPDSSDFPSVPYVTVNESMVLTCWKGFLKGISPGASKLRAQHLLDVVSGSTAPAVKECLYSLTCFMNLLPGKGPTCLAP